MSLVSHERSEQGNIAIIAIVIVLGMVMVGSYLYFQDDNEPSNETPTVTPVPTEVSKWKTYINEEFGFSFEYPSGWYEFRNEYSESNFQFGVSNYNAELYPTKADSNLYDVPEDYATFYVSGKEYTEFVGCEGIETDASLILDCVQDGRVAPGTVRQYEFLEEVRYGENTFYKVMIKDIENKDAFQLYSFNDFTKQAIIITTYADPEVQPSIGKILNSIIFFN